MIFDHAIIKKKIKKKKIKKKKIKKKEENEEKIKRKLKSIN